jgi:ATP/ADP translocase
MTGQAKTSRTIGIWAGGISIVTGLACAPFVVVGGNTIRTILILALSIITQLVSGATLLYAALTARDTDQMKAEA